MEQSACTGLGSTAGTVETNDAAPGEEESKASISGKKPGGRDQPSASPPMSRIGLNDHKAGMEGLDKEKINQIIIEASKGSKYYENEVKKEKQVTKRIEAMLANLKKISPAERAASQQSMDKEAEQLESQRVLNRIIVHIDMDAFYAAVEMRDDPQLRNVPMAVGSYSMLSTSNYLARRFGVRAAMPGFIAKKLCPQLVIVRTNFDKYRAVSAEVREIMAQYDPCFSPMGLDESYLDLTDYVMERYEERMTTMPEGTRADGDQSAPEPDSDEELFPWVDKLSQAHWDLAESVVQEIRSRVHTRTGLTASAGIAPNMMLAKVASDMNKPNGQYMVEPSREGVLSFVRQLPIRKICGIGKVTERMLKELGVTTCQHLFDERAILNLLFSTTSSHHFLRIAMAIGSTDVHSYGSSERKSMSTERTFAEISKEQDLLDKCHDLCQSLSEEMIQEGVKGRTITLKVKNVNFEVHSHADTVPTPVSTSEELFKSASQLLRAEIAACKPHPLRLRLMGVRVSTLQTSSSDSDIKQEKVTNFFQTHSRSQQCMEATPPVSQFDTSLSTEDQSISMELSDRQRGEEAVCPVCHQRIPTENVAMNKHIDECLSRITIEEELLSREDRMPDSNKTLKNSPTFKRQLDSPRSKNKSPKRRKVSDSLPKLETFWK